MKTFVKILSLCVFVTGLHAQGPRISELVSVSPNESKASLKKEMKEIIISFVEDYKTDRHAREQRVVGIRVPEVNGKWTITVTGKEIGNKKWEVLLNEGLPTIPTAVYRAEVSALKAIYNGEMNAMTAQMKAFSSDYAPLDDEEINGYQPTEEENGEWNAFSFHFWTKGFPEVIPFRPSATRKAHGAGGTIFYYEKGLRTGWLNMLPGDRVREDAREQAMPFPMMGVIIKGTAKGIVDGEPVTVSEGNTVFIPANVHHKWWNESDKSVELILIMFGKGA
ncbi:cupin domain-containing protein [Croceitalea rosinachiae]|uniref:Cupin domain-containing protein n=1 Tax=Croceitalea rosinachiae TaxID=3075596 RepID=A0ABU3A9X4_9FLAO|nr:cupin domain-containing protein [Croceitalea sp. F388]MDT0606332.1 cupin domain-containing protein [Croceitalea sp. F388]